MNERVKFFSLTFGIFLLGTWGLYLAGMGVRELWLWLPLEMRDTMCTLGVLSLGTALFLTAIMRPGDLEQFIDEKED